MMDVRTRATLLGAATLLAGVAVWLSPAAGHAAVLTIQEYPLPEVIAAWQAEGRE